MKNLLPTLFVLILFSLNLFGQIAAPKPSATPPAKDEGDVVKITTSLIQVDVTVTDSKGRIVSDLKPEEIEIYENGKKQDISNFTFISNVRTTTETPEKKPEKPGTILPPPPVRPERVRRTIALVVDDLTLSFESTYYVRRSLKKFVDEQMQEGDLVAIIRTGAGIGALQQFTTDRRQLYAAIEKVRWNSVGTGNIGAFAPLEAKIDTGQPAAEPQAGERTPEGIEKENNDFRASIFATGTLGAVNYVVRGMQDLPGRKSILLLSDGFKLFTEDATGFRETGRVLDSLRRLADMANRASVVIYTMDARGLQVAGLTAADNTSGRSPEELEQAMSDRRSQLIDTQDGLRYLAAQTGGIAIVNNNDLSGGIRKILDDQSYYLIGYQPDDETFDPKTRRFNKLEIKVMRPGLRVRYRSGFFGISDEKMQAAKATGEQRLVTALTSPFAINEIAVRLNALFGSDAKQGSFVRSLLHVRAQDMKFTDEPDGTKKVVFDVLAIGFGDNGVPIDQLSKTYTITVKKDIYDRFMREGFVYEFTFPIKKPGAYQFRVALRDRGSEKVGSANQFVEVPNIKKSRLILSGVYLENVSFTEWKRLNDPNIAKSVQTSETNPLSDTSLRQFKRGTVLNYGFTIFNAKFAPGSPPQLTSQLKIFRDGKQIYVGSQQPVPTSNQPDPKTIGVLGSLSLGTEMQPGDYILQIEIIDTLAKEKYKTASQFVQFEILE